MDIQKIPPHDEDAEEAVIGSMLTDKDAVIAAIEVLKPEDFYRDDNKTIFEAEASLGKENVFNASPYNKTLIHIDNVSDDTINLIIEIWEKYYQTVRSSILDFMKK